MGASSLNYYFLKFKCNFHSQILKIRYKYQNEIIGKKEIYQTNQISIKSDKVEPRYNHLKNALSNVCE